MKLISPIKSLYVVPICLPTYLNRQSLAKKKVGVLIDYVSTVPIQLETEEMAQRSVRIFTQKHCRIHQLKWNVGRQNLTRLLCSTGCGVRSGTPLISHSSAGAFELIGVTAAGAPCDNKRARHRFNKDPPVYIDVYPYVDWISNVVAASVLPTVYPRTHRTMDRSTGASFALRQGSPNTFWVGRTFVAGGAACRANEKRLMKTYFKFYMEEFAVKSTLDEAPTTIIVKISAGIETTIKCVKLHLPNRLVEPKITGLNRYNITIEYSSSRLPALHHFQLALYGTESSPADLRAWDLERQRSSTQTGSMS